MSRKIALTGSTGLVGQAVTRYFRNQGDSVTPFVRPDTKLTMDQPVIRWDVVKQDIDLDNLEGQDVVIHLAGASIAGKRWTPEYKKEILNSRVDGTTLIAQTLTKLKRKPKVFICASAIGYYGPKNPEVTVDETSPPGTDFLATVCKEWEEAALMAKAAGIRVIMLRFGMILDGKGGALAMMLPIFKSGLGGVLGDGKQVISWIALPEIPLIIDHLINSRVYGPVNVVSPQAVSNREFTKILGSSIHRPTTLPVPSFGLRLLYGEMADVLLLKGAKVKPAILSESGYTFQYPELAKAFKFVLATRH